MHIELYYGALLLKIIMKKIIFYIFITVNFIHCSKNEYSSSLKIIFEHNVDGKDLEFNLFQYIDSLGNSYKIDSLMYFTSNFKIYRDNSYTEEIDTFYFTDISNTSAKRNTLVLKDLLVPGDYSNFSFVHGLTSQYNSAIASDTTKRSLPIIYKKMYWNNFKEGQYHYMKLEGIYNDNNQNKAFYIHSGPSGGNSYYFETPKFTFPSVHVSDGDTLVIHIQMDVAKWWKGKELYNYSNYSADITENSSAQDILKKNGSTVYKVSKVEVK